jgi:biotin/methionine sulfoxide reductase
MTETPPKSSPTLTHWGAYDLTVVDGRIKAAAPVSFDADPSLIGNSIASAVHHRSRVNQPMVRKGWLEQGPKDHGGGRGAEPFVPITWDHALDLAAGELQRVTSEYGNKAIFGGSYGWASAGRFHHSQGLAHRFLNCVGGYVRHMDSYSSAAARVLLPHIVGCDPAEFMRRGASWETLADNCELIVMFGGMPLRNAQVDPGGPTRHVVKQALKSCRDKGVEFVNISPLRDDAADFLHATWLSPRPNSDTALMLGLAYVLITEDLHDGEFLQRCCVGFARFSTYVLGTVDGMPKSPEWAAAICGLGASTIQNLARRMAGQRTYLTMALSLQRAQYGEQPYWMAVTLAAMLGGIGLPGRGIGFGVGSVNTTGRVPGRFSGLALDQGHNGVDDFIPVARIVEMLENPGGEYDYDGQRRTYPDIRMIYWCGGNPFHHHQDLNRLIAAWQRPETIIVHEPWWTPTAKHADLVFPATTPYERNDIGYTFNDENVLAMKKAIEPVGGARNDYDIFSQLAARLGVADAYTEGRNEEQWLRRMYSDFLQLAAAEGVDFKDFDRFWSDGSLVLPMGEQVVQFAEFRENPNQYPLATPSGRIEIYSEKIASFDYEDCPGHPTWMEPDEWLGSPAAGEHPLHLISPQPATRLHSQLDCGDHSLSGKVAGREPIQIHPDDAVKRGIVDGDLVKVFNDRGACLAGARVTDGVRPGVVALPTGAWYDSEGIGKLERHGNPNVLTRDLGTSRLAQGPTAHTTLVEVVLWLLSPPKMAAHEPPPFVERIES